MKVTENFKIDYGLEKQSFKENRISSEITKDSFSLGKAISDTRTRTNLYGPYINAAEAVASMLEDN